MKKSVIMVLALTALFGCSKMEQEVSVDANGNPVGGVPVKLTGVINTVSRAIITGTTPATTLNLTVFRADQTAANTYPTQYQPAINAEMSTTGAITMSDNQKYLGGSLNLWSAFIAMHPRVTGGITYDADTRIITFPTLDGYTDIMCSDPDEGNQETANQQVTLSLKHLLTLIQVDVKGKQSQGNGPNSYFGLVTGITLKNKKTDAKVTLPAPATGSATIAANTATTADLPLAYKPDGTAVANVMLQDNVSTPFGVALMLPDATDAASVELLVKTVTNPAGQTVNAALSAGQSFEKGKSYTITLEFDDSDGTVTPVTTTGSAIVDYTTGNSLTGTVQ